ncbi:MAG: GNAT family N-acetyltransferase [Coriobacteriia bacterium]|nr:GNAT family N-acetyltransferase [Coriobacteriia bacterium]
MQADRPDIQIRPARREEATAIAEVVRAAFLTEAERYGTDIPPLRENAADVAATFDAGDAALVAEAEGALVGTIRGETEPDGAVVVRRLAVLPEWRRCGIARALLVALEAAYPDATHFRLFTGSESHGPLALYRSLGYELTRSEPVAPGMEIVFLDKYVS